MDEARTTVAAEGLSALSPRHTSISEQIAADITALIQSGALQGGSVIAENALAEQLGVSRSPVREALALLAADGLVQRPARRSAFVTPFSKADCRDLYDARALIDGQVAYEAVMASDPETVALLQGHLASMQANADATGAYRAELEQLQLAVYSACPNGVLADMAKSLWRRSLPYRSLSLVPSDFHKRVRHSLSVHKQLVQFFADGDAHAARVLMSEALRDHCQDVLLELDLHR